MRHTVGPTFRLRLALARPPWVLGPGWAAVGGAVVAFPNQFTTSQLVTIVLVWLLADPLLGSFWDMTVGEKRDSSTCGLWGKMLAAEFRGRLRPVLLVPYARPGSPGYRIGEMLAHIRQWGRDNFWPQSGQEMVNILLLCGSALVLASVLGRPLPSLVVASILLTWPAAALGRRSAVSGNSRLSVGQPLLRALTDFCLPWLMGALAIGGSTWLVIALGICYTGIYFALSRQHPTFLLIIGGQLAALSLLIGLRHPVAVAAVGAILLAQWGIYVWSQYAEDTQLFVSGIQPLVTLGLILTVISIR